MSRAAGTEAKTQTKESAEVSVQSLENQPAWKIKQRKQKEMPKISKKPREGSKTQTKESAEEPDQESREVPVD